VIAGGLATWHGWADLPRLLFYGMALGVVWWTARWMFPTGRLELIRRAMLVDHRCPQCAYQLALLPLEPDGCTVCPECGAAWKLASPGGAATRVETESMRAVRNIVRPRA
jgi:hypothetical protein